MALKLDRRHHTMSVVIPASRPNAGKSANGAVEAISTNKEASGEDSTGGECQMRIGGKVEGGGFGRRGGG